MAPVYFYTLKQNKMKRKIFLGAVILPCLLFAVISVFAFRHTERQVIGNQKAPVTDEFVDAYYELTEAFLNFTNGYTETPEDTTALKSAVYEKFTQLHNVEDWETQLDVAAANEFIGFPTFAYHNPYSTCIYYCTKQANDCYMSGGGSVWNYTCETLERHCFKGCKDTFLTGNP